MIMLWQHVFRATVQGEQAHTNRIKCSHSERTHTDLYSSQLQKRSLNQMSHLTQLLLPLLASSAMLLKQLLKHLVQSAGCQSHQRQ
jgi:hypothetical protein